MELKKLGATQFIHPDPSALRVAYMIYEKDAQCNKWMKFVEKLKGHFTIVQVTPQEIVQDRVLVVKRDDDDGGDNSSLRSDGASDLSLSSSLSSLSSLSHSPNFHVLFVGGGMPAEHYRQMRDEQGREAIREAVGRYGVGYVGTCAGAYIAIRRHHTEPLYSFSPTWELLSDCHIWNHEGHEWQRGMGSCQVQLTDRAKQIFETGDDRVEMFFRNGPLFSCCTSNEDDETEDVKSELLGTFVTNINTTKNSFESMVGTGAIVSGHHGQGRVLLFSAHPESSGDHINELFVNSIKFVARRHDNDE